MFSKFLLFIYLSSLKDALIKLLTFEAQAKYLNLGIGC